MSVSPLDEYTRRRVARKDAHARLARMAFQISNSRLAAVAVTVAALWLTISGQAPPWVLALPVLTFTALAVWHDRVLRHVDGLERAIALYDRGIARLEDRWQQLGEPGRRYLSDAHIYTHDLDIFGASSLFQLLSQARTTLGDDLLASWLSGPAPVPAVRARQQSVAELRAALDFREALATAGRTSLDLDTDALRAWATAPLAPASGWLRAVAVVLAIAIVLTTIWWIRGGPLAPLFIVLILKMLLTRATRARVARIVRGVEAPLGQLDTLGDTLALIEERAFESPRLAEIREEMMSHGVVPSQAIRRLERLADMLDWRRNAFFAPISAALSWPLHLAAAIENWRREFGSKVIVWLSAVAELEALSSLAAYSYEHPDDPFPVLVEDGPARFEGTALGHPLVPTTRMVRNDVMLTPQVRLLIVSGSNMSGKSTLLRTVGVNVVLAMAGAPVRARSLLLTPLAVGATLHIHDSLQAGKSRFYAEIARIRAITDLTGRTPAPMVLLDELFQGTNSHDRRIGAEALLLSLMDRGAVGLTTTHDLALAAIADQSDGRAVNVHFEDEMRDGELVFDYKMKPGRVTHSNALALMRAVGLPVDRAAN